MATFLSRYQSHNNDFSNVSYDYSGQACISQYEDQSVIVIADSFLLGAEVHAADSDAAFIAGEYLNHQEGCFARLLGEFACLVWDKRSRCLFAARDPLGQRAFYYAQARDGDYYFSNVVKPLIEQEAIGGEVDKLGVAKFMAFIMPDQSDTCFQHVKKIPGGCYLCFHEGRVARQSQFWKPAEFLENPLQLKKTADYYELFRGLYQTAIADFIKDSKAVASHLSGGLDSTSVTNLAAQCLQSRQGMVYALAHAPSQPQDVKHLPGWNHDDRFYIEAAAKFNDNIQLHYLDSNVSFFEYTNTLHDLMACPPLNPANMLWVLSAVNKTKQLGCDVLLTGTGGNSTISWPLSAPVVSRKRRTFRSIATALPRRFSRRYERWCQGYRSAAPWLISSVVQSALSKEVDLFDHYQIEVEKRAARVKHKGVYYNWAFNDYAAPFYTAVRHAYGVAQLDPTLDKRVVEFFLRAPESIFTDDNGRSRLLVREGLKGLMPEAVLHRSDRGIQASNWYYWFDAQKGALFDRLQAWQNTPINEFLNIASLLKLLRQWSLQQVKVSQGRKYACLEMQYRYKLLRAIEVGLFLEPHL